MPNLSKSFQWWINTCNAPNVGYNMDWRNQQTRNGITYYDCSSFVWYGLIDGGFDCVRAYNGQTWPFATDTMASDSNPVLQRLGFTRIMKAQWPNVLKAGDILIDPSIRQNGRTIYVGHTEVVYADGPKDSVQTMGAHNNDYALPDQVSINSGPTGTGRYKYLCRLGAGGVTGFGSSLYVIAALCGNLWQESTINPALHQQGGGTAYGLFQWDGSRKTALLNWLSQNGYSADSAEGQIAYFIHEDFWSAKPISTSNGIHNLTEFLQSSITDIDLLTEIFCDCWEIAGTPMMANRKRYARECYDYIMQNGNTGSINEWKVNLTGYLVPEDSFNNAVMFYRNFSAGGGGGWPFGMPPRYPHKMPVWMMTRKIYC